MCTTMRPRTLPSIKRCACPIASSSPTCCVIAARASRGSSAANRDQACSRTASGAITLSTPSSATPRRMNGITVAGSHTTPLSNTDTPIALTGTWQPDGRSADPAQVGLGSARDATLARFAGLDPNGVWTLHLSDLAAEGQGELVEWSLHFTLVPEPAEIAVGGAALLGAFALARSRRPSR